MDGMRACCFAGAALLWLYAVAAGSGLESSVVDGVQVGELVDNGVDPVTGITLAYPTDGVVERSPVVVHVNVRIRPGADELFAALYGDAMLCVEANGDLAGCSRFDEELHYHRPGNCTARAYLMRGGTFNPSDRDLYWQSPRVSFTVLNGTEFDRHVATAIEIDNAKHRLGYRQSLTDWASHHNGTESEGLDWTDRDDYELLVGVRTAVVSHFPFRQAIRETWASRAALPPTVKVFFLGCRPFPANDSRKLLRGAIALEKRVFGDLLTDELDCDDSYALLADKTKEFFTFAAAQYPRAPYVMIADDDLYLRLDKVLEWVRRAPRRHYYAGDVRAYRSAPIRNPAHQYYLPVEQYPPTQFPPYAAGPSFLLSMDCAQFIAKNRHRLRSLNGMDDISVGLWLLVRQIHVVHLHGLHYLREAPCLDDLVGLSDLTISGIRVIHANIVSQRPLCGDFERSVWLRQDIGKESSDQSSELAFPLEGLHFDFAVARSLLTATMSTSSRAGVKVDYLLMDEVFGAFSRRVCGQARLHFPDVVGTSSCDEIDSVLRLKLMQFCEERNEATILKRLREDP